MRVLVTGVSGFSGSAVARRLARGGLEVVGTFRRETSSLAPLRDIARLHLVRSELIDIAAVSGPFDAVVHVAATSPGADVTVAQLVRDNIDGTFALIEAALRWRSRRFIFFSSLSVHGEITQDVVDEETPVRNPDSYGACKLLAERRLAEIELPALALRLPGIVGPGAHRNWLAGVADQLRAGAPIAAFHLDRPFNNAVHVDDIVALIVHLLGGEPRPGFDVAVLGARGSISVRETIDRLAGALGVTAQLEPIPPRRPSFTLSSARAIERYGYAPMEIGALVERYGRELRDPGS